MGWVLYVCVLVSTTSGSSATGDCFDKNLDYSGHDINYPAGASEDRRDSAAECQDLCSQRTECNFFTWKSPPYHSGECWLKTSGGPSLANYQLGSISGPKQCNSAMLFVGPGIFTHGHSTYLSLPDFARSPTSIQPYPIQEPSEYIGICGAVAAFIDEKIMICGGETPYSPPKQPKPVISKNCYTLADSKDWTPAPSMRMERTSAAGTYTQDGWWVTGGRNDTSTEMLVNGQWMAGPELPTVLFGHCLFRLNSDQYLLAGGVTSHAGSMVERLKMTSPSYLLKNNVYNEVEGGPLVVCQACAMLGEDAYVVGGVSALTNEPTSEVHIWSEGEWAEGPELPLPVYASSLVAYQDHLYLLGGWTGSEDNEVIYKLDQGTWTVVEDTSLDAETTRGSFPALVVPQK